MDCIQFPSHLLLGFCRGNFTAKNLSRLKAKALRLYIVRAFRPYIIRACVHACMRLCVCACVRGLIAIVLSRIVTLDFEASNVRKNLEQYTLDKNLP